MHRHVTWRGRCAADYGVFEVDEAFARRVFDHLTPNYMIVTNLFRDQLDRYGEIDITMDFLHEAIDKVPGLKLILNGDDHAQRTVWRGARKRITLGLTSRCCRR